jgi:hypothetical protein
MWPDVGNVPSLFNTNLWSTAADCTTGLGPGKVDLLNPRSLSFGLSQKRFAYYSFMRFRVVSWIVLPGPAIRSTKPHEISLKNIVTAPFLSASATSAALIDRTPGAGLPFVNDVEIVLDLEPFGNDLRGAVAVKV